MVDNQHKKIRGYRDLSQEELNLMNEIKTKGEVIGDLVKKLQDKAVTANDLESERWVEIAKMDLQKGFMALTRSVAKPTNF